MAMMKAEIDYGERAPAKLWGDFDAETAERFFMQKANQCFGIRKSIMCFKLVSIEPAELPDPWRLLPDAAAMLKHSGDTIVWNTAGDKIKSEWD